MAKGRTVEIKTAGFAYRVLIEAGALQSLGRSMRLLFPSTEALLVSDDNVFGLYGDMCLRVLAREGWQVKTALVRSGEQSKSLDVAGYLYDMAAETGLDRNSPIIALGGGVVGDLAGFVAATYLRGVPLVMVPTTLLSQVDSSVGGKVAVNHSSGKNLIGSFYPPRLVLIDPQTLSTLPRRQLIAGLAEVIKYGIIEDGSFFSRLENELEALLQSDPATLAAAIESSVCSKARVVEKDEFEKDHRRLLNFGHTIGHALEAATGYSYYLHGEAVLAGMIAAVRIALALEMVTADDAERMTSLMERLGVKPAPPALTAEQVIDKLSHDKKRRGQDQIFVLPTGIGKAVSLPVNDKRLIKRVVAEYLSGK